MIHLGTSRDEWQHPEEIVAALKLEAGQTVADIEAGTGCMVAHLSEAVGGNGTVIAIDAEAAMIEYLAKHLPELGPAHIVTQKVDFHDPELKLESVHGVLALDTCQSGRLTPGKCTTV
ncbi:class I SAM-dependent methyltransferase [Roseiconus lacunae]|uniref:class I SAM-dependent methyltransferase n=1 Tax=Roseiconus lacunae TaxID=2605694 RepID=UPI001E4D49DA|nr:methyltransferase domain-containing protein [Roseiconus lacunae]MCD0458172.1 methyltransferase domain-containing protein [Roseiconus lacunae]